MSERLLSVGLDVGTTSTQMIFSELAVENRAGSFSVPEMEITGRRILYQSPVYFTPLLNGDLVDGGGLRRIVEREYAAAGLRPDQVDTGALIITGETGRKENARRVLQELTGFAGEFVVAAAGPHLESVLAAKGSGAVQYSEKTGKTVLHMDIGGGTSNLALIRRGTVVATACLNVGGRLIKLERDGTVTYLSPVLKDLCPWKLGDRVTPGQLDGLARTLASALEMAAGLRPKTELLERLATREAGEFSLPVEADMVISFSGGVADCMEKDHAPFAFGDMGPALGRAIRESALCADSYMLGSQTIRATVIGAGCHSACLSGSTVFHRNIPFPMKNLPVIPVPRLEGDALVDWLKRTLSRQEETPVLAIQGMEAPRYAQVAALARDVARGVEQGPVVICLEQDMAKALGQALAARLAPQRPVLCIDRVRTGEETYLDIGAPVGPALPVVVKTLVIQGGNP